MGSSSLVCWMDRISSSIEKSRAIRGGNYVQLATVGMDNKPKCRTVVFRGFYQNPSSSSQKSLKIVTDMLSEKIGQLRANSGAEICWWFPQSNEQYRFSGRMELILAKDALSGHKSSLREETWKKMNVPARQQFYAATQPGRDPSEVDVPSEGDPKLETPPENFVVMLLWPNEVKYLNLDTNFNQVDLLKNYSEKSRSLDAEWVSQRASL